jgi:hypothetical protein
LPLVLENEYVSSFCYSIVFSLCVYIFNVWGKWVCAILFFSFLLSVYCTSSVE